MDKLKLYYEKYTCLESNEITTFVNRQTFFFMGMTFLVSGYSSTDSLFIQLMISLCSIIYTIIFKFGFIKASICALHKLEVGIKKIEQCVDSIYDSKYKIENCSPQIVRSKIIDSDGKKIHVQ